MKIRNLTEGIKDILKQLAVVIGIVAVVIVIINNFSIQQVSGHSMDPTFDDGDYILVALNAKPNDMDVVILTTNKINNYKNEDGHVIKRYYEDYSTDGYFVLGDNSDVSYDSRYYGEAPKEACEGVVLYDISKGFRSLVATINSIF